MYIQPLICQPFFECPGLLLPSRASGSDEDFGNVEVSGCVWISYSVSVSGNTLSPVAEALEATGLVIRYYIFCLSYRLLQAMADCIFAVTPSYKITGYR